MIEPSDRVTARPLEDWEEDDGPVLWWNFPVVEPPYVGTPIDDDFPGYVTHWTKIAVPTSVIRPVPQGAP